LAFYRLPRRRPEKHLSGEKDSLKEFPLSRPASKKPPVSSGTRFSVSGFMEGIGKAGLVPVKVGSRPVARQFGGRLGSRLRLGCRGEARGQLEKRRKALGEACWRSQTPPQSLKHLHKETVRINRIIKSEFEKIEPEDWE
jgi:hypothetical protein